MLVFVLYARERQSLLFCLWHNSFFNLLFSYNTKVFVFQVTVRRFIVSIKQIFTRLPDGFNTFQAESNSAANRLLEDWCLEACAVAWSLIKIIFTWLFDFLNNVFFSQLSSGNPVYEKYYRQVSVQAWSVLLSLYSIERLAQANKWKHHPPHCQIELKALEGFSRKCRSLSKWMPLWISDDFCEPNRTGWAKLSCGVNVLLLDSFFRWWFPAKNMCIAFIVLFVCFFFCLKDFLFLIKSKL